MLLAEFGLYSILPKDIGDELNLSICIGNGDADVNGNGRVDSVSYTHLDVYKRQL